jgi:hypothetical protein
VGDGLAVNLEDLDRTVTAALPSAIDCLDGARTSLHRSVGAQDAAFAGEFWLGFGDLWEDYRRLLEEAIERHQDALDLSAIALRKIAQRYRQADGAAQLRFLGAV